MGHIKGVGWKGRVELQKKKRTLNELSTVKRYFEGGGGGGGGGAWHLLVIKILTFKNKKMHTAVVVTISVKRKHWVGERERKGGGGGWGRVIGEEKREGHWKNRIRKKN